MRIKEGLVILGIFFSIFIFFKYTGFITQNTSSSVSIDTGIIVIYSTFDGSTTQFAYLNDTQLQNISSLTLERTLWGKMIFNEPINITQDVKNNVVNLDVNVNISNNYIQINTTSLSSFKNAATFFIYNLSFSNPSVLKNGQVCSSSVCVINSYSGGVLSFNTTITDSSYYSVNETVAVNGTNPPPGGGGNPGGGNQGGGNAQQNFTKPQCTQDRDCSNGNACWNNKCVQLFDIRIINFNSPVQLGEYLQFDYLIKILQSMNRRITVNYWIQNAKGIAASGTEIVYLDGTGQKIQTSEMFLPVNLTSGTYNFYVEGVYGNYRVRSYRTVDITVKERVATITLKRALSVVVYILIIGILLICILILLILLLLNKRRNEKEYICENCGEDFVLNSRQKKELERKGRIKVRCPHCKKITNAYAENVKGKETETESNLK